MLYINVLLLFPSHSKVCTYTRTYFDMFNYVNYQYLVKYIAAMISIQQSEKKIKKIPTLLISTLETY